MAYGKKKKQLDSPGAILPNNVLFEEVQTSRAPQFSIQTQSGIETVPYIELGEVVYHPMVPAPWMLPPEPIDYGTPEELWKECYDFVYDHLDIMNEELYHVYVGWVIHTWVVERFDSVPYLHFFGERNTGKTRALDLLNLLCYRPMLSPSVSGAAVYYAMDYYHPTLLLDEFEMYEKQAERKAEVIGVLNAGYRRGQGVYRVGSVSEGNPTLRRFSVFGPKALSSIEDLPPALDSRCITFIMVRAFKKIRRLIDKDWAQQLRGKLLKYRFDHLFDPIPKDMNPLDLPDGRLIELFYPLDSVSPTEEISKTILRCARNQYDNMIRDIRQEKPALLYNLIIDLIERKTEYLGVPETLSQKEIRDAFNEGLPEKSYERISKQSLPSLLDKLNMRSDENPKTRLMEVIIDPKVLERHKTTYVLSHDLERVEKIIDTIRTGRPVLATLDTLGTVGPPASVGGLEDNDVKQNNEEQDSLHKEGNKKTSSVSSISSVASVSNVGTTNLEDASLQEQLEWVLGELSCAQDLVSTTELAEKSGLEYGQINNLLFKLTREGHAFSPRIDWWKATG